MKNYNCSFLKDLNDYQRVKFIVNHNDIFYSGGEKLNLESLLRSVYRWQGIELKTILRCDEAYMPTEMSLFSLDKIADDLMEGLYLFLDLTVIENGEEKANFLRQLVDLPLAKDLNGYLFVLLNGEDCEMFKRQHTCQIVTLKTPSDREIKDFIKEKCKVTLTEQQGNRLLNVLLGKSLYEVDGIVTSLNGTPTKAVDGFFEKLESNGTCFDYLLEEFLKANKSFCYQMNAPANDNSEKDYVKRTDEIEKDITVVLGGKNCHSFILLGNAGCGKTTLVKNWGYQNADKYILLHFDSDAAIAGTGIVGSHEQRISDLIEFSKNFNRRAEECGGKKIVIFIDEIHRIMGNGGASGVASTGDMLKTHLTNRYLFVVGATTIKEYEYIATDEPLSRRFWTSRLSDMTMAEVIETLQKFAMNNYGVTLNKELAKVVIENSKKIERVPTMPAAPIKLLDFCLAYQEEGLPFTKENIEKLAQRRQLED